MKNRTIVLLKCLVFPACLIPVALLVWYFTKEDLGADPVNTITHSTGNWTMYFLLISLAITPIRRLSPKLGWLIRFRRMLGLFAFFYATLHLAAYIWLYSAFDWNAIYDDILRRTFIQFGVGSWFILLLLALTSPAFIMRKMGGRNWRWLHWLVYPAAIAAVIHYWKLVKTGVRSPMADTLILSGLLLARILWSLWKRVKKQRALRPA